MAIPIKAIPTLYGEEAARLTQLIDEVEELYENSPKRDVTKDPRYIKMLQILKKSERAQNFES